MPTLIVNDNEVFKIQAYCFESVNTAQVAINTTYWRSKVAGGSETPNADITELLTQFDSTVAPLYKGVLVASAAYSGSTIQRFRPKPVSLTFKDTSRAGAGTVAGDALPQQTAFVLSFRSLYGKTHGRNYLPFPGVASMDANGTPSAAYLVAVALFSTFYESGFSVAKAGVTTSFSQLIYTPQFPAHPTVDDPIVRDEAFTAVAEYSQRDGFATQRRRGFYGRVNAPLQ